MSDVLQFRWIVSVVLVSAVAVSAAEISFKPVSATGTHQIAGPNSIYLLHGGQRVYFEFYISKWDSNLDGDPKIKTIQIATNVGSYGNPSSPSVLKFPQVPCSTTNDCRAAFDADWPVCDFLFLAPNCISNNCCQAFFIDRDRTDYLAFERAHVHAVDTTSSRVGISMDPGEEVADVGATKYVGSLVLDVPADAIGEFILGYRVNETFVQDENPPGMNNLPLQLIPAKVFVGVPPVVEYSKQSRYFRAQLFGDEFPRAYAVKLVSLHHPARIVGTPPDFSSFEGEIRWLGPPQEYTMSPSYTAHTFMASRLQCQPHFATDWLNSSESYVFGAEVVPDSIYELKGFDNVNCTNFDTCGWTMGTFQTGRWSDVVAPFEENAPGTQPDISDIGGIVDRFRSAYNCPSKVQTQLQPNVPDPSQKVGFADVSQALNAFRGFAYPFPGPTPCP